MEGDTVKEKKRLCWLLPVVILLLAAVGWFFWKYTFVDGTVTARSADTIDLRGREISEEKLRTIESRFPDAHILWDVTVGGKSFDGESESIVTADFTTEDIPSFARLKNLKEADVSACSDFPPFSRCKMPCPKCGYTGQSLSARKASTGRARALRFKTLQRTCSAPRLPVCRSSERSFSRTARFRLPISSPLQKNFRPCSFPGT